MIAFAEAVAPKPTSCSNTADSHVVVFRLNGHPFGLPVSHVREVLRLQQPTPVPKAPFFVEGILNLRGRVIAVIDLRKRFDLPTATVTDRARVLIVRLPTALVGLIVDAVEEVRPIPPSSVQPPPEVVTRGLHARYLAGVARAGAELILLLNLATIFSPEECKQLEQNTWPKSS